MKPDQVEDLQERITHQELAIEALHESVVRQDRVIADLQAELAQVKQLLRELRPALLDANAHDETPPHY
ncbi:MAG: SlyX family protein [Chromatiaceae bacterium]|nr:SlyX family protein [Gammaproteobacteria bacterium]MCP5305907.1 SlyX family protein [Chromatiaceae bacterium]MCP5312764.1 SlyX family protein [Chromatiaceae bacterium]